MAALGLAMESCPWSPGCQGAELATAMDVGHVPHNALGAEWQLPPSPVHRKPNGPERGAGSERLRYCRVYRGYV